MTYTWPKIAKNINLCPARVSRAFYGFLWHRGYTTCTYFYSSSSFSGSGSLPLRGLLLMLLITNIICWFRFVSLSKRVLSEAEIWMFWVHDTPRCIIQHTKKRSGWHKSKLIDLQPSQRLRNRVELSTNEVFEQLNRDVLRHRCNAQHFR